MKNSIEEFGTVSENPTEILHGGVCKETEAENSIKLTKKDNLSQWAKLNDDMFSATSDTTEKLPSGFYTLSENHGMVIAVKNPIPVDEIIYFPETDLNSILEEIKDFWNKKETYKKYKFLHKRGILFYGPAGSGKSVLVKQIICELINKDGIVLDCANSPGLIEKFIRQLRIIESERPVIYLYEDIDAIIRSVGEESILSFIDGEKSDENCLFLATTNYPEKLDKRIVSRPRRFDRVIKIDNPCDSIRRIFFEKKLKIEDKNELESYVKSSVGFSFGALAELVISTKCFGKTLKEAEEIIRNLLTQKRSSEEFNNNTGFK